MSRFWFFISLFSLCPLVPLLTVFILSFHRLCWVIKRLAMKRPKDTTAQYSKHSSSTLEIKVDVRRILEAVGWSFVYSWSLRAFIFFFLPQGPPPLLSTASFSKYKLLIKRKRRLTKWRRFHGKESSPLEAIRELG